MYQTISNMKTKDQRGFTLVELLIVIAIIAILAAIAIPQFAAYRARAVEASMTADARNIATAMEAVFADCQRYPTGPASITGGAAPVSLVLAGCEPMPTVNASAGNTVTMTLAPTTYTITVTNPAARAERRQLTLTHLGVTTWGQGHHNLDKSLNLKGRLGAPFFCWGDINIKDTQRTD